VAISKALRAEILRRDNYACRYCGAKAPDVRLTIDHVTPVALGGGDVPTNLVTACSACNSGKAAIPPNAETVADVSQDALRWARARDRAVAVVERNNAAADADIEAVLQSWADQWAAKGSGHLPDFPADVNAAIARWIARGIPVEAMQRFIGITIGKYQRTPSMIRPDCWVYFAGCCWRYLTDIEDAAKAILAQEES